MSDLVGPSQGDTPDQLLREASAALWALSKAVLAVKPSLTKPYPDAPEHTPWSRFVHPAASRAYNLKVRIQRHLKAVPAPAGTDLRAEVERFADIAARGGGAIPAADVAWRLRQILAASPVPVTVDRDAVVLVELKRLFEEAFPDGEDSDYHYGSEHLVEDVRDRIDQLEAAATAVNNQNLAPLGGGLEFLPAVAEEWIP